MRWVIGVLFVSLVSFVSAASAQGRTRVALGSIEGGPAVRRSITSALEGDARVEIVGDESSADVVLEGAMSGRGRRRALVITARGSGGELGSERARGANARTIGSAVSRLLDAVLPNVRHASTSAPEPTPERVSPTSAPDRAAPRPAPSASSSAPGFGDGVPLLSIAVGAGLRSRETSIHVAGGMTRSYHASPYTELYARIDTRPLGNDPTYARGLFAWGEIGYAVGLGSQLPDRTQVSTTYLRLGAHVGYLLPIDSWLEIGGSFGFGWERYDLGANVVLPAIDYSYLRPALRARIRIVGELLVLGFEGGYRALLSRGGLSDAFGPGGDSFGYDLAATISGATDFGLSYSVEAGWAAYVHQFSGAGAMIAQGTDGSDGGYRFIATIGYALR